MNATNDDGDPAARPHGVLPFGYQREYGLVDGTSRPVRQYPDPDEAKIVRELYRRVLAGESIRSVALDFQARGLVGRRGRPFSAATLRVMLMKDAYRGYRNHKGQTLKASWPAIVDDATWHGVQALLADPTRLTHTGTAIKHVLSTTLRCACGGPMTVAIGARREPAYVCHDKGCTRIPKADVDAALIGDAEHPGVILAYLSRPDVAAALTEPDDDTELGTVRGQLASKRANLEAFEDEDPETPAEARLIGRKIEKLEAEIKELEQRESALLRPNPLSRLIEAGPGAAARWAALPVTARRAIAAILLSETGPLGLVRIKRVADSASDTVQDRIEWVTA